MQDGFHLWRNAFLLFWESQGPIIRSRFESENWLVDGQVRDDILEAYYDLSIRYFPLETPLFYPNRTWRRLAARACGCAVS